MVRSLILFLMVFLPGSSPAQNSPADFQSWMDAGDTHWENRANNAQGAHADPQEINEAIAAYHRALDRAPDSLAVRWRLMRALYFKGEYTTDNRDEKKKIFQEGKAVGEEFLGRVRQEASGHVGKLLNQAGPLDLAPHFKDSPDVVAGFFWSSANWGGWALAFGKLQAVRQGAATKIRDLSTAVIAMDPNFLEGGGYRVLGRLHHQTPAVPFITGWASTKEAVSYLKKAVQVGPRNFLNRLYLAEALWDLDRDDSHKEALKLVEELIRDTPGPGLLIEERRVQELAQADLNRWRGD
jgi:tetratricopeptide (TPR) repeat protein